MSPSDLDRVRDVVSRLFRAVEEVDLAGYLKDTYHRDIVIHEAACLPYGGDYHGLTGAVEHARAFLATWSPYRLPGEEAMDAVIDALPDHAYVRGHCECPGAASRT
jgi:hypothetical protein